MVTNMKKKMSRVQKQTKKLNFGKTALAAKGHLKDWVHDQISDEEYAMILASDEKLRTVTNNITQGILNPTPLNSLKTERTNEYLDVGMGVSAFWDELRNERMGVVDDLTLIDSKIMYLDLGLDKDISPHMRKSFLNMAGISEENMGQYITFADYAEYEANSIHAIREYHMERLGFNSELDMDEASVEMLNTLVDDSVATGLDVVSQQVEVKSDLQLYGDPRRYEELYGMDAKELHEIFGDESIDPGFYPEYAYRYTLNHDDPMYSAMREYHALMNSSTEMNQHFVNTMTSELNRVTEPIQLSMDDIQDLGDGGPSLSDEDLANLQELEEYMEQ